MEILKSLGVNATFWVHLACFLASYVALTQLIFKPYLKALREREARTVGSEEHAARLIQESTQLQGEYEQKAKALNARIKSTFDSSRAEALKEYDRLIEEARAQAQGILDESRAQLEKEVQAARKALATETPNVSLTIASKLAGKDLSA